MTSAVYSHSLRNGFVDLDDPGYVTRNPYVKCGVSWLATKWAFTTFYFSNWHPLTWLSLQLDTRLYGLNPAGFHFTNLTLHVSSTLLVYWLLRRMTGCVARSAIVAALFALHPLHVESAAWISERKDLLSTFFGLLSMLAYVRYAEAPSTRRYAAMAALFVLSLLAKPMLVTLPLLLLLLDFWPLRRWTPWTEADARGTESMAAVNERVCPPQRLWRLLVEKVPLLSLSIASCVVTVLAQNQGGSLVAAAHLPLAPRVSNAAISYVAYLGGTIWPTRLAIYYAFRGFAPSWQTVAAGLVLVALTALAMALARRASYLAVGWFWYLGSLVPVIGVVQVGTQGMADRYTYIPLIGIFIAVVWAVADLAKPWRHGRIPLAGVSVAGLSVLAVLTWQQIGYWKDSLTLWRHAAQVTRDNSHALACLSFNLLERNDFKGAEEHARRSLEQRPNYVAHLALGRIRLEEHRYDEAEEHYRGALALHSLSGDGYNGLGSVYLARGEFRQAEAELRRAVSADPFSARAQDNLGTALLNLGEYEEAVRWFEGAIRLAPQFALAYDHLGTAHFDREQWPQAAAAWHFAVRIDPQNAMYRYNLACALWESEERAEARREYREALRLDPSWPTAAAEKARTLLASAEKNSAEAQEALRLAKQACQATDPTPSAEALDALAAAYAATGRFDRAVPLAKKGLQSAERAGQHDLASAIQARLADYEAGQASNNPSQRPDRQEDDR